MRGSYCAGGQGFLALEESFQPLRADTRGALSEPTLHGRCPDGHVSCLDSDERGSHFQATVPEPRGNGNAPVIEDAGRRLLHIPLAARVDLLRPINLRVVRQCDGRALMAPFAWKATIVDEILDARRVEAHVVPHMEAVICTNCNGVDAKPLLFGALPSIAHGWSRERARRSS